jgi:hypothetical protein
MEMYEAHISGRMEKNPASFWYGTFQNRFSTVFGLDWSMLGMSHIVAVLVVAVCGYCCYCVWLCLSIITTAGELGFFDNYIIPLAKKLKDCVSPWSCGLRVHTKR